MGLRPYLAKRDFQKTPEPRGGKAARRGGGGLFVVQKHDATRLHYDFRLEMDGVLKSWAVPKGPSLDPSEKRLAVHVEDHPLDYAGFEGVIPKGEYGGGPVIVWDRGRWAPQGDPHQGYAKGHLAFTLTGEKLRGAWALIRMRGGRQGDKSWLLIKEQDGEARRGKAAAVTDLLPESVKTGRGVEDLKGRPRPAAAKPRAHAGADRGGPADPSALPGARKAPLPETPAAQLATLVTDVPDGDDWLHEIKFDGYRILARVERGRARLISRNGKDWTARFPSIAEAVALLRVSEAVLDGELVSMKADGTTSFQGLQASLSGGSPDALRYYAFDLLHLNGWDLSGVPLVRRKEALERVLAGARGPVRYSEHVRGRGRPFYEAACGRGLEGIVSKLADGPHRRRRTRDWVKIRCGARQEFVIGGYSRHAADPRQVGALLLGVFDEAQRLRYAGRVGTGFSDEARRDLKRRLDRVSRKASPFDAEVDERGEVHWAEPTLVAEVQFTEWTAEGRLRHPSFLGLREDKPAREIVRERPAAAPPRGKGGDLEADRAAAPRAAARARGRSTKPAPGPSAGKAGLQAGPLVAGVSLSHPDRVLWPGLDITKRDLASYYEAVAERMLPFAADRPLMILRCPEGQGGACFFQKHIEGALPKGVRAVEVEEKGDTGRTIAIDGAQGLVSLVQMGALELHGWGSRADRVERPDHVVFDLDPAPDVPLPRVVDAALEVRERLKALGLRSFVKTTGGKGLHVEVPIARVHEWDDVKAFSRGVAEALAADAPDRFISSASKARRAGKIFVDWLRNGRGATSVVPYSTRARPGATVATPLSWDELDRRLRPDRWTVATVPARLASRAADPWKDYESLVQRIPAPGARGAGRPESATRGSPR